ncbi:MAG: hemolysin family protein [Acidimicrobiia bacterium]
MISPADIPLIVLLGIALVVAIFLAAAESSLLRVAEVRARALAEGGSGGARRLLTLLEHLPDVLNMILLLALLAQIGAATITGILAQRWFGNLGVTISSVVLTVLLFIYGEAIPKTYAVRHSEKTAMLVARPVAALERVLRPLVALLVWVADIQLPGKGITTMPTITEEELKLLALEAAREGEITQHDRELIDRVFRFGDRRVEDIMVPRPDIVAVATGTPLEEAVDIALRSGHRRLPLYEGTLESIVGVVKLRELIARRGEADVSLRSISQRPLVVPESKVVSRLLADMQEQDNHMAVVVDEYGVTVGIVTIEDVAEDLLGRISEGPGRPNLEQVGPDHWIVSGAVPVEDVVADLGLDLPEGEWNTVAGMMLGVAGKLLAPGSTVELDGHDFTVESVRGRRITRVSIQRLGETSD